MPTLNKDLRQFRSEEWSKLEQILQDFESVWQRGERPALDEFVRQVAGNPLALVELVHLDLEYRLKSGEPVLVETYVENYPALADVPGAVVGLLATEYELRRRREPGVMAQDYLCRFPQYRDSLLARLAASAERITGDSPGTGQLDTSADPKMPRLGLSNPQFWAAGQTVSGLTQTGYEILGELGRGGMGIVYRAYDHQRRIEVALKTLPRLDPSALLRFKQEFRGLAGVVHPNLVTLYELIADGPQWFFAMEFVDGVDFLTYVRATGIDVAGNRLTNVAPKIQSEAEVRGIKSALVLPEQLSRLRDGLRQLAEGVEALHKAGKLHRDIKPSNVLVTPAGRVVLLDFGLATEMDRAGQHQSIEQGIVGTVAYMAPEQAGELAVSPAADWYSVGVMLYEALTGQLPFMGDVDQILRAKQDSDGPAPNELVATVAEDLNALCVALLSRNHEARPAGSQVLERLSSAPAKHWAPTVHSLTTSGPPFVGREQHMGVLLDAFRSAQQGHAVMVCVQGRSGVGKSVLVQRFLAKVAAESKTVILTGRCYENESVPYKALDSLVDALSHYLRRLSFPTAQALLPRDVLQLARVFPVLRCIEAVSRAPARTFEIPDPQELRRRAFAALRELLARLGEQQPLVLWLDDLQWGDVDSADLLTELLRSPDPPALLLVASFRDEERTTCPFLSTFFRSQTQAGAIRDRQELVVEALTEAEARQLAITLMGEGGTASEAQASLIARESGGNPFFVSELVHFLRPNREPREPSTVGDLALDEVLWARIQRLAEQPRILLELVTVAGRPIRQRDVCSAAKLGTDERQLLAVLRFSRLIRSTGSTEQDEIETYHDRVRETVVARLAPAKLVDYHCRLALALQAAGQVDPEVLAVHFQGANDLKQAGHYYALAAAQAAESLAFDRAAKLYRHALQFGSADEMEKQRLRVGLGDALANAGRGAMAAEAYLAASAGLAPAQARDLQRRAAQQLLTSGHVDQGLPLLRTILDAVGLRLGRTPRMAFWSLLFHRVRLWFRGLRFRERDASQVPPDVLAKIDIGWAASLGLSMNDNIRSADIQTRHLLLALRAGEPSRIARALAMEVPHTAGHGGEKMKRRADRLADTSESIARRLDDPYLIGLATAMRGIGDYLCEHYRVGLTLMDRAEVILRERCTGIAFEMASLHTFAFWSLVHMGEAAEMGRRCTGLLREAQNRGDLYAATNLLSFTPFVRLMADDPEGAREDIQQALKQWTHQGYHIQHYALLQAQVAVELYTDNGSAAWRDVSAQWPAFAGSFLKRVQLFRIQVMHLHAYSALAAAVESRSSIPYLRSAQALARRLRREKTSWSCATALYVDGAAAAAHGNRAGARALLIKAATTFEIAGMQIYAVAVRRRLGELIGGAEGEAIIMQSDAWMAGQNIRNPARMASVFAAAFPFRNARVADKRTTNGGQTGTFWGGQAGRGQTGTF